MIAIYLDSLIEHMQLQNEWHKEKWLLNQSIINVNKKKEKTKEIKKKSYFGSTDFNEMLFKKPRYQNTKG